MSAYEASRRYMLKHLDAGLCQFCPRKLAANSRTRCDKHLALQRKYGKAAYHRKSIIDKLGAGQ